MLTLRISIEKSSNTVFYQKINDPALRFGDVLRGYVAAIPRIQEPTLSNQRHHEVCDIKVSYPEFVIIMSPCCSIKEKIICLAPLIPVNKQFFRNPYLAKDLTRINRKMYPEQAWIPEQWEKLPEVKKEEERLKDLSYAFLSLFVYDHHSIFPEYTFKDGAQTGYYMIDFRMIYSLNCDKIINPNQAPLETKCLQLSIKTRAELRDKISYFFGRTPEEDKNVS